MSASDGKLWLFGGIRQTQYIFQGQEAVIQRPLNDLWAYDPAEEQWSWMVRTSSTILLCLKFRNLQKAGSSNTNEVGIYQGDAAVPGARFYVGREGK